MEFVCAAREPGFCGNDSETEGRKEKLNRNDQIVVDTAYHPVLQKIETDIRLTKAFGGYDC